MYIPITNENCLSTINNPKIVTTRKHKFHTKKQKLKWGANHSGKVWL